MNLADTSLDEHLVPYVPLWSDLISQTLSN